MSRGLRVAVVGMVALVVALASPGVANADNSNNNTNTNDVTSIGNPNITYEESNANTNWPPAGSSWPPNDITNSGGENSGTAATPIVMPMGQSAPPEAATNSTSAGAGPIVPVNTP
jgi:hypothetical protein